MRPDENEEIKVLSSKNYKFDSVKVDPLYAFKIVWVSEHIPEAFRLCFVCDITHIIHTPFEEEVGYPETRIGA